MPDSSSVSRETSLAVKVLLARLGELAGVNASAKRDPRSILLAIPDEARERVAAVLQEIQARASPGSEGLVSGARLLLDAARELWTPDKGEGEPQDSGTP
jgi:hypothetical protein